MLRAYYLGLVQGATYEDRREWCVKRLVDMNLCTVTLLVEFLLARYT